MHRSPQKEICIWLALDCSAPILHLFLLRHSHLPLPHWNYFELFYARLQQEELSEEPTQPSLHQGCHRGRRWPAVLRGPRNQTRSQPHTGRKEAEPLPREMRASGTSLSDRSRSGPLPAPALPGEPHCCCTVLMLPTPKAGSSFQHYSNLSETRLQTTGCFRQARS